MEKLKTHFHKVNTTSYNKIIRPLVQEGTLSEKFSPQPRCHFSVSIRAPAITNEHLKSLRCARPRRSLQNATTSDSSIRGC